MKDSGIEWLGEIPEHWEVGRLKFYIKLNPSKNEIKSSSSDSKATFLPMENIYADGTIDVSKEKTIDDVASRFTYFREGDVLLAKITPCFENGKSAIASDLKNKIGFGTTEIQVLRSNNNSTERFLYYLINSNRFMKFGETRMTGSAGQKRVPTKFIKNFRQGFPPLKEQKTIADFLDRETGRIEELIEKKKKLIELLEEKRQATITQAVTKGLDSDVEMKDSGIEWLGEIPKHWKLVPLKYLKKQPFLYGANESPDSNSLDNPRYIRITDIDENGELKDNTFKALSYKKAGPYLLKDGDILFARSGATVGKTYMYKEKIGEACFAGYLIRFRADKEKVKSSFINYYTQTKIYDSWIKENTIQATIENVSAEKYGNLLVTLPPKSEQDKIINYLDQETNRIDGLISKTKEQIANLKEYKQALISNAVTGKIKISN